MNTASSLCLRLPFAAVNFFGWRFRTKCFASAVNLWGVKSFASIFSSTSLNQMYLFLLRNVDILQWSSSNLTPELAFSLVLHGLFLFVCTSKQIGPCLFVSTISKTQEGKYCTNTFHGLKYCGLKLHRYFPQEEGMMQHSDGRYFPQWWNQGYWTSRRTKKQHVNGTCTQITNTRNPTC